MVLFKEITVIAAQVALIGDIDRPKAVPGNSKEKKADAGKIVK
jgi:hypothetical protein